MPKYRPLLIGLTLLFTGAAPAGPNSDAATYAANIDPTPSADIGHFSYALLATGLLVILTGRRRPPTVVDSAERLHYTWGDPDDAVGAVGVPQRSGAVRS